MRSLLAQAVRSLLVRPPAAMPRATASKRPAASATKVQEIAHWDKVSGEPRRQDVTFVIPTYNRPLQLVTETLPLLQRHGVPLDSILVLVTPGHAPGVPEVPEWESYVAAMRRTGFSEVRLVQGGVGLTAQMLEGMRRVGVGNYMVVMSDTVKDIHRQSCTRSGKALLRPLAAGELLQVVAHGRKLLVKHGCAAWSSAACHNAGRMHRSYISRRLGLLDGNFLGMLVPADYLLLGDMPNVAFFVGLSCWLWSTNRRMLRYMMLSCCHRYKQPGGQASRFADATARVRAEKGAIENLAMRYPGLVSYAPKEQSKTTMPYKFAVDGPPPFSMKTRMTQGRPREHGHNLTAETSVAARARRYRQKNRKKSTA